MHWLQAMDTALFRFVNGSLSNPVFDWLMPVMSGSHGVKAWFILFTVAAGVAALCFGRARARVCTVVVALIVPLGDPLIVNTIKHLVERPRPCLVLPGVIERLGCTASGSMPSAHAANWFALTMVLFLFYRRSLWVTLPLALTVSFSRVYNGVHYPSDVLAGMILGAGYAAAGVVALQTLWNWVGKKWFSSRHARFPSWLNTGNDRSE